MKFFSIFILVLLILNISFIMAEKSFGVDVEVVAGEEVSMADIGRNLAEGVGNLMSFREGGSILLLPIITVVLILILLIIILFKKKGRKKQRKKRRKRKT